MRYRVTIEPQTPFGSLLLGETLFGQLCWAVRFQQGNDRLEELLEGYVEGRPFAVVSDAFPQGFLPLPALPVSFWQEAPEGDRKALKAKRWVSEETLLKTPPVQWRNWARSDNEIQGQGRGSYAADGVQAHNTISRQTSTTGKNEFAPFKSSQTWFATGCLFDIYVVTDDNQFSEEELWEALEFVGQTGFGRDASVGLGKYALKAIARVEDPRPGKVFLALASSFPGEDRPIRMWYRVKTHFGRHGAMAAVGPNPFKKPLLLAERGAVYEFEKVKSLEFVGKGILGTSLSDPKAVHQGYAPVISLTELNV